MRRELLLVIPLLFSWVVPAEAQDPLSWGEMQAELRQREGEREAPRRIQYGAGIHQYGELSVPEGDGPFPLAVVVHGGCWQSMADLGYMRPFARELVSAGWAVWSLEFRRMDQEGGAWPAMLEDVAAGADHAQDLAADHPLDLSRVVTVGHSSGGHLALWLAGRSELPPDSVTGARLRGSAPLQVAGVLGLAAIADLDDYRQYGACGRTVVEEFLAAAPGSGEWRERLEVSDPARVPARARRLLVMGALDPIVPPPHARVFARAAAGGSVEVAEVPGAGHFELVAPWTGAWTAAWDRIEAFLNGLSQGA